MRDWRAMASGHRLLTITGSMQGTRHQGQHVAPQFLTPTCTREIVAPLSDMTPITVVHMLVMLSECHGWMAEALAPLGGAIPSHFIRRDLRPEGTRGGATVLAATVGAGM